jgi:hypothetical protein
MKVFIALISGVLLSSAAIAQHEHGASTAGGNEAASEPATERSSGQTTNAPANAEAEGAERVICRRVDRSESRLARQRVCMTAGQWREHNRND